jgi:transposase-like protein
VNLNAKQRKVLAVLQSLPAGAPVRRIGQAVGEDVTVDDMRPLVVAELVIEVQRTEGPLIGFSLTPDGDQLAAQIRQAHHPDILTPEMAGAPPEGSLRERVTPEMLLPALRAGWNIGKMALKFDATPKGLQQLITEYGLYNELAEEGRERQAGSQQAEEGKTVEAADKAKRTPGKMKQRKDELFALFDAGRGETWADKTALAQEFSCSDTTIDYWRRQWVIDRRHNPRPLAPETAPESPQPLVSITVDEAGQALATITGADPAEATEQIREQITDLAAPQVPAPETAPAIAVDDKAQTGDGPVEAGEAQQAESPPATREQLQALKDHFSGSQVRPADPILPELAPKLDKQPELQRPKVGEVLEAEVCKVDQAYVLSTS